MPMPATEAVIITRLGEAVVARAWRRVENLWGVVLGFEDLRIRGLGVGFARWGLDMKKKQEN